MHFQEAVTQWQKAEVAYRKAKLAYETKYNTALLNSQQSNTEKRVAEAELAAAAEQAVADISEIRARGAEQLMLHMRNPVTA